MAKEQSEQQQQAASVVDNVDDDSEIPESPSEAFLSSELEGPSVENDANDTLLSMRFNQDGGCLAVGTASGFRICNVCPFQETFRRSFAADTGGGIGTIEMLFRCNLLALVGGGPSPQYPPNKVLIWDDHLGRPIGELSFRQRVLTVKLRRDRICVALWDRVYVYNFGNLALLDTIVTGNNTLGLLCISTDAGKDSGGMVLACPGLNPGQVRVELYAHRKTLSVSAHDSPLAAIALTVNGSILATASQRGTLIRLFHVTARNGQQQRGADEEASSFSPPLLLREFRRGVERAKITCLAFSLDTHWLSCASDRGTVHIFYAHQDLQTNLFNSHKTTIAQLQPKRQSSSASKLAKSFLPKSSKKYLLEQEHSYVQVKGIPHPHLCAFVPDKPHTIAVAGLDEYGNGCLLLATFGPEKGVVTTKTEVDKYGSPGSSATMKKSEVHKIGYHRFFKKGLIEKTRHRATCENYNSEDNGGVYMTTEDVEEEASALLSEGIHEIVFGNDDDDGFVNVEKKLYTRSSSSELVESDEAFKTTTTTPEEEERKESVKEEYDTKDTEAKEEAEGDTTTTMKKEAITKNEVIESKNNVVNIIDGNDDKDDKM